MSVKDIFHSETGKRILEHNNLCQFETIWKLEGDFIEEPNYERGGWSGIILHEIKLQNGQPMKIIIKRQENHTYKSITHPLRKTPTLFREYSNILRLENLGIPTLEPLYYGERRAFGNVQALLVIRFLEEYKSLDEVFREGDKSEICGLNAVIDSVAQMVARFHYHRFQHSCLYGKHIFVKKEKEGPPDIRLIDLEKMHFGLSRFLIAVHDLSALYRHSRWPENDMWKVFVETYLEKARLEKKRERFYSALDRKIGEKISKRMK